MSAKWKQKPLEQVKPSNRQRDIAMLQQQVKVLEHEKDALHRAATYYKERLDDLYKKVNEHDDEVLLFRKLLRTEVMVPTKEGFKLLTGDELREYCVELRSNRTIAIDELLSRMSSALQGTFQQSQNDDKL